MEMPEMNDQRNKEQCSGVRDQEIRAALDQHWAASDANDFETEHLIYHENAVLEYGIVTASGIVRASVEVRVEEWFSAGMKTSARPLHSYEDSVNLGQRLGVIELQDPPFLPCPVFIKDAKIQCLLPVRTMLAPRLKRTCLLRLCLPIKVVGVKDQ